MIQPASTKLLAIVRKRRQIKLEELLAALPEFTWNQVFSQVAELRRRKLISLRRRGFAYELSASSVSA